MICPCKGLGAEATLHEDGGGTFGTRLQRATNGLQGARRSQSPGASLIGLLPCRSPVTQSCADLGSERVARKTSLLAEPLDNFGLLHDHKSVREATWPLTSGSENAPETEPERRQWNCSTMARRDAKELASFAVAVEQIGFDSRGIEVPGSARCRSSFLTTSGSPSYPGLSAPVASRARRSGTASQGMASKQVPSVGSPLRQHFLSSPPSTAGSATHRSLRSPPTPANHRTAARRLANSLDRNSACRRGVIRVSCRSWRTFGSV
jgi:hypothetical protein